jgi:hypothetical protein
MRRVCATRREAMTIELTEDDLLLLKEILESALKEIKAEIRHTETKDFRNDLVAKESRIRGLLERI